MHATWAHANLRSLVAATKGPVKEEEEDYDEDEDEWKRGRKRRGRGSGRRSEGKGRARSQRVQRLSEVPVDSNKCLGAGKTGSSRPGRRLQDQLEILPGRCGRALIKETLLTERD